MSREQNLGNLLAGLERVLAAGFAELEAAELDRTERRSFRSGGRATPDIVVFNVVIGEEPQTGEGGSSAAAAKTPRIAPLELEVAELPHGMVAAVEDLTGAMAARRLQATERAQENDLLSRFVADYLAGYAESVPTGEAEARELGRAAGIFAAHALLACREERGANPANARTEEVATSTVVEGESTRD